MAERPKILITGGTGLLGANMAVLAAEKWRVVAAARSGRIVHPGVETVHCDVLNRDAVRVMVTECRPQAVLHLAAEIRVDWCEDHPAEAAALTVGGTANVLAAAGEMGCPVVYMSTDSVFDGTKGDYRETDQPSPINVYAETKLSAEALVLAGGGNAVVRGNFIGWSARGAPSLGEWILRTLREGQVVPGFADCFFSPLTATTLAATLLDVAERRLTGLFHAGCAGPISKFQLAQEIARQFGYDVARVQAKEMAAHPFRARRPLNTSLDAGKLAQARGIAAPSASEEIEIYCDQWKSGYPTNLKTKYTP